MHMLHAERRLLENMQRVYFCHVLMVGCQCLDQILAAELQQAEAAQLTTASTAVRKA
jgi:hypothetical protein